MHYHVIVNMPGYLPDSDEPELYESFRDAQRGAKWHRDDLREAGYTRQFSFNLRRGWYMTDPKRYGRCYAVSIADCSDAECAPVYD